ncbi:hypothetical protein LTR13_008445 [Exophiala sideris]|uniref:Thioesterase domain-containing protein n=1 Tax=Exophiala sideris TaxID=1016849 RepID=A0ABR0J0T6_9EURO|nr:hypothetical protein LTR13_008445 [Exophiala sideris]KAK5053627.1 hypothetical protein LTR69_009272 [Exophiala sideris]
MAHRSTINTLLLSSRPASLLIRRPIIALSTSPSFNPVSNTLLRRPTTQSARGFWYSALPSTAVRKGFRLLKYTRGARENSYSTVVVHSKGQARVRRTISFLTISTLSFIVGGYLALSYAPPILVSIAMGSMPTDVETLTAYEPPDEFSREVDEHIKNCALARSLRADPDFIESRPHMKIPPEVRQHNLTAGTLAGPGMIVVPPYHFNEKDGKSMVQIFYVGPDCSGHPGIVHGGFLATILDEGLARCAFPAMPNKVGVTANLQINYQKPTMAGQFLVLKAKTTKVEGRKAWAEGWIESLEVAEGEEPEVLVKATALFIEPKHANILKSLYRVAT